MEVVVHVLHAMHGMRPMLKGEPWVSLEIETPKDLAAAKAAVIEAAAAFAEDFNPAK